MDRSKKSKSTNTTTTNLEINAYLTTNFEFPQSIFVVNRSLSLIGGKNIKDYVSGKEKFEG